MSGCFLTPRNNDFEVWPCSHGTGSKAGVCCKRTIVIDTLGDHPYIRSVRQPVSPDSNLSPQLELKEIKGNDFFTPQLLLSPLPLDTRRHSDSSVVLSPERELDGVLSKSWGCQYCPKHAPLIPQPLCTACLSHLLSRANTKWPSPCASVTTPCICAGQPVSPTGLYRCSPSDKSDLSELNKSLENITGHKHVPNSALLRVPSVMFETRPNRSVRSQGDEKDLTKSLSAEQMSKPAAFRRASVCIGERFFIYPVGWTSDLLWLKWALCCCRRKSSWCF